MNDNVLRGFEREAHGVNRLSKVNGLAGQREGHERVYHGLQ